MVTTVGDPHTITAPPISSAMLSAKTPPSMNTPGAPGGEGNIILLGPEEYTCGKKGREFGPSAMKGTKFVGKVQRLEYCRKSLLENPEGQASSSV